MLARVNTVCDIGLSLGTGYINFFFSIFKVLMILFLIDKMLLQWPSNAP